MGPGNAVCVYDGAPRFSSLLLLDLLAQSGTEVWYAGDIDPEGLLIAQRLKRYYPGEFHCWHMSTDDYEMCMSAEEISQRRQKMLEKVEDPELKGAAEALGRRAEKPGIRRICCGCIWRYSGGMKSENDRKVLLAFSLSSAYTVRGLTKGKAAGF